jgi:16S rRNA (cytosine967-C5)-methyltransferase
MIPSARISAAVDILDLILDGAAAERVLTSWARNNRYAGSGDRAAIRDHVFTALRCRRSFGLVGGADTGRGLMIGALRSEGQDAAEYFTCERFAPEPLSKEELHVGDLSAAPRAVQLDCPDWLIDRFEASIGAETDAVLEALRHRAPVYLRVNLRKSDVIAAQAMLEEDGVETAVVGLVKTALEVTKNPRRVSQSEAYSDGVVELQDAASQAVVQALPLRDGMRVLDYCAGGGGKTLAMAGLARATFHAHDIDFDRMSDMPARTSRAGISVQRLMRDDLERDYDLVLVDAPCSGSGTWRRSPEAKWQLTPERLTELTGIQADILDQAADIVAKDGTLAYATCSVFQDENDAQIEAFLARNPGWSRENTQQFLPGALGDGFYLALLRRVRPNS